MWQNVNLITTYRLRVYYNKVCIIILSILFETECTALEEKLKEVLEGVHSLCGRPTSGPGGNCSCQYDPKWTSIPIQRIGGSNLRGIGTISFVIPSNIPNESKEVQVYIEATTGGSGPTAGFSRLTLYTEEDETRYSQYIYVLTWHNSALNTNSDNMWFPLTKNRRLYLHIPKVHSGHVDINVYVIGYR